MRIFIIGLLILSAQAFALELNGPLNAKFLREEIIQEKSYFDTLGDLFDQGELPSLSKIANIAWSGRCFYEDKPNEPLNGGYIFRKKRIPDVGPLGRKEYEAGSYWSKDNAPDYYDNLSLEQVLANQSFSFITVNVKPNLIEFKDANITSQLKVSGPYLVETLFESSEAGPIGKKRIFSRCYYFIPELND